MKLKPHFTTSPCHRLLAAALCLGLAGAAPAATIVSSDFSFGYEYIRTSIGTAPFTGEWAATTANNTSTTQGDFTFTPTVTWTPQGHFSTWGPVFANRTLTDGKAYTTNSSNAYGDASGSSAAFGNVSIAVGYTGTEQVTDITIEITGIRIYAASYTTLQGDNQIQWVETTPGVTASSPEFNLTVISSFSGIPVASNYADVTWNPADFAVAGTTATRSFDLDTNNTRALEGLEIFGRVVATVVPEPSAATLLGIVGMIALLRRRRPAR